MLDRIYFVELPLFDNNHSITNPYHDSKKKPLVLQNNNNNIKYISNLLKIS